MKRDIVIKQLIAMSTAALTFVLLDFFTNGEFKRWPPLMLFLLFFPTLVFWEHYRYWRQHREDEKDK